MNASRFLCWLVFALVGSLAQAPQHACAQPIQLTNAQVVNSQIQFNVAAPTNAYYRVDSSTDLVTWLPLDYYYGTSALHTTGDSFAKTNQAVFYRVLRVNPGLAIIDFNLGAVTPGQQLEIYGQFLPPLSQYSVQIGGTTAPIVSGTSARLFVTVPAGAATGLLTISNVTGEIVAAPEALCILSNAVVRFQPPPGLATTGFTVENEYGSGVLLSNTGTSTASFSLPVPEGFPTLSFASVPGQGSNLFFCVLSLGADQVVQLDANSTAAALVFMNWALATTDPNVAPAILGFIETNAAVQAFAQTLSNAMVQSQTPYRLASVSNAYQAALGSVLTNQSLPLLVMEKALQTAASVAPRSRAPKDLSPSTVQIYDVVPPPLPINNPLGKLFYGPNETGGRYLRVTSAGLNVTVDSPGYLLNPLDRVVAFQSIDVDASFPGGRPDFDNYWRNLENNPQVFATNGVLHQQRVVNANRFFEKFDVVGNYIYYFSSLVDSLYTPFPNSSVALPPQNGLYVVRGVGMGFYSAAAHTLVSTQMTNEYAADVVLNVGDGALGRLLFLSDPKTLLSNAVQKAMSKIYGDVSGVVAAQPVQTPKDFILDTLTATKDMLIDFAKEKVKDAANAALEQANEGAAETLNTLGNVADALSSFSKYGSLAERIAGLYDSSALETSFILVGDPFSFTNVIVNPNPFGPGDTITVTFQGSPKLQSFDPNNPQDFVRIFGTKFYFRRQLTSVNGPDADGVQTLSVTIPISVGTTHDGVYTMIAQTQGRTATTTVRLATPVTIQSVSPLQGFVPVANFNGSPYPGTAVRLQGTLFTSTDTYLFAGNGTKGVASTNVQPNNFQGGDVTVYVPPGAISGPLQILHNTPSGILTITGAVFTVITVPPTITAVQPADAAPIGSLLRLTVNNAGTDPNSIYYQFPGSPPQHPQVLPDGSLLAYIVYGTQTGPGSLTVFTPAGLTSVPFNVLAAVTPANLEYGSSIAVGAASGITLNDAISFANGTAYPSVAQISNGIACSCDATITNCACTNGGIALGPNYVVTITGISAEDANVSCNYDIFNGQFTGHLTFSGTGNTAAGTYGQLSITGISNQFNAGTFNGPITISGTNNSFGNPPFVGPTVFGPMVISGRANTIAETTFENISGTALTITGNFNFVGTESGQAGASFLTNNGDGLVINGGRYNVIDVMQAYANAGNGVTLSNGAAGNTIYLSTGAVSNELFGVPGTGNRGHGIALIGNAVGNIINTYNPGSSGNGLDGVYMDGPGVNFNSFVGNCSANGRNGVTITNGANNNSIGFINSTATYQSTSCVLDYNAGSGLFAGSCGSNSVFVVAQQNGLYGVLLSDATNLLVNLLTASTGGPGNPLYISGNGIAGLRLEKATTGVSVGTPLYANLGDGLQMDGTNVTVNTISCAISGAQGDGAFIANGAHNNLLTLCVSDCNGDGILLQGATNNMLQVYSSASNSANGIHITSASRDNYIAGAAQPPPGGNCPNVGVISNVVDGCLVDAGSIGNTLDSLSLAYNGQDGLGFSGTNTTFNQFVPASNPFLTSAVKGNGRDGIRFEMGTTANVIGLDPVLDTNGLFGVQVSGGDVEAGIMITDPGTAGNLIEGCNVTGESVGLLAQNNAEVGRVVQATFQNNYNGMVLQFGAHRGLLGGMSVQFNTNAGIVINNANNIIVGGDNPQDQNQFYDNPTAIEITGGLATNNWVNNNQISVDSQVTGVNGAYVHNGANQNALLGTNYIGGYPCGVRIEAAPNNLVSDTTIENLQSAGTGIIISSGATGNLIASNTIQFNMNVGVLVSDAGSVGNKISGNSITANGKGIQLSAGGNDEIRPPILLPYGGSLIVDGTVKAPDGSIVEVFWDPGDEGQIYLGSGLVVATNFSFTLLTNPAAFGPVQLNATVTDPGGNTSEFSGVQPTNLPNLAFTATNAGHRQVFFAPAGNKQFNLTGTWNPNSDDYNPALPAGVSCLEVAFVSLRTGNPEVFVMQPGTNSVPAQVTTNAAGDYEPSWLVPCQRLVFVSQRDGNPQIYAVNIDGSSLQRLTTNSFADISPSASPDGSKIVFISNRSGANALWIMNADGSGQAPISGVAGLPSTPSFGPDNLTIAMAITLAGGASEIATVTINGTGYAQITSDGAHATHPAWTPDGQNLIFSSDHSGSPMLYQIPSNGGPGQALTTISPNSGTEPSLGGY